MSRRIDENDQLCEDSEGIAEGSRCRSYGGRKGLEVLKLLKYLLEKEFKRMLAAGSMEEKVVG